jgi:diaminohydroxyphosphoribosylaminopyrimidine deaminase / 5-amino-6-(5-phosphoribosylamino)uracil reductase
MHLEEPVLNQIIQHPMELALRLAERGRYSVSPNPMVGSVLLKDGRLIGYGYHLYKGDRHAESKAIDMAGDQAKDAVLYVTLEPCYHQGSTPPCVDKVIASGIKEVHFSSIDPNPLVNGKSVTKMEKAGIKLVIGELKEASEELNEIFYHYMKHKTPFVIAKWAMTADGKIATSNKDSKWITGKEARNGVHYLRNSVDAILIGKNTALSDNPTLNVRDVDLPVIRNPIKVILGNNLDELPLESNIFTLNPEKTFLVTTGSFDLEKKKVLQDKGVSFMQISDLNDLLQKLGKLSVTSLLIEGGGVTLAKFLQENLINKFYCYMSPKFIGGKDSISPFGADINIDLIKDAKEAEFTKVESIGNDILIQGRFKKCSQE